jgi:GDPmannose 4,6-dehydratase
VEAVFSTAGLDWQDYVVIDPAYFRPTEVDELCGDASKAAEKLGWRPKISFAQLVQIMVEADLREAGLDPIQYLKQTATGMGT